MGDPGLLSPINWDYGRPWVRVPELAGTPDSSGPSETGEAPPRCFVWRFFRGSEDTGFSLFLREFLPIPPSSVLATSKLKLLMKLFWSSGGNERFKFTAAVTIQGRIGLGGAEGGLRGGAGGEGWSV